MMNAPHRHYCRNPHCRQKLTTPTDNERAAFCCRGCWEGFHWRRCIVCGEQFTRKAAHQRLCRRAKCKSDFRRLPSLYMRFERGVGHTSGSARRPLETSIKPTAKSALEADRASFWVQIAGPSLTAEQFHFATLPVYAARRQRAALFDAFPGKSDLADVGHVPVPWQAERKHTYPGVVTILNDRWRVSVCRDSIQWILQTRRGGSDSWRGRSFCRTSEALVRSARLHAGPIDPPAMAVLLRLPERIEERQ